MKAAVYQGFQQPVTIDTLADPRPEAHGVVIQVKATGLCRSDWHGWMGHDPDITPPHVPGHEFAGVIVETGPEVKKWKVGTRVTVPFVCACGQCHQCVKGDHQVCDYQFQPGFTHWGSFAEFVAIEHADINVVELPETMSFIEAASLGCRFATAFRAIVDQGEVTAGQWVAVYGCGGVGLSAIMIAKSLGARVIAIDINERALMLASENDADICLNASEVKNIPEKIRGLTHHGANVSVDALGDTRTCLNSIESLGKRGKHIQIGLMTENKGNASIPMSAVIAQELEIIGSHGMQAHRYDQMLDMIIQGKLNPEALVSQVINLEQGAKELMKMDQFSQPGMQVITF